MADAQDDIRDIQLDMAAAFNRAIKALNMELGPATNDLMVNAIKLMSRVGYELPAAVALTNQTTCILRVMLLVVTMFEDWAKISNALEQEAKALREERDGDN